jgi:5'-deoxynucleotidase YfbR-like HD superfamily hydrolase
VEKKFLRPVLSAHDTGATRHRQARFPSPRRGVTAQIGWRAATRAVRESTGGPCGKHVTTAGIAARRCILGVVWSPDAYLDALRFAAERHRGQRVPGTDLPYVVHVAAVAAEVMGALARERFADPDLAVQCALLHDTIEDTGTDPAELVARFGRAVTDGVRALSKDAALPRAERMADSLRRIGRQPREVWIVKLADRITNLARPPAAWSRDQRHAYRDEAGEILRALAPASLHLADRLAARIEAYRAFLDAP